MKKSISTLILFLLVGILFSSCCNCGQSTQQENRIRGTITVFGNDPFSDIGIKTEDNTNYVFICSKELKEELIKKQGWPYVIQFSELKEEYGIKKLVVEKAIPIIQK